MAEQLSVLGEVVTNTTPATFPDTKSLAGHHVTLERMKESDFQPLWASVGVHTNLWKHWPEGPYSDSTQFANSLKKLLADTTIVIYTVYYRSEAVGYIVLLLADLESRVIEIGLVYGPSLQRTRAATEAFYLLVRLAFDGLNNRRLEWKTDRMNTSSQRAAERYGFSYEGCLRQHRIQKGRNRDTLWYSMLDSEWPVCKRAFEAWLDDANFDEQGSQKRSLGDIRQSIMREDGR